MIEVYCTVVLKPYITAHTFDIVFAIKHSSLIRIQHSAGKFCFRGTGCRKWQQATRGQKRLLERPFSTVFPLLCCSIKTPPYLSATLEIEPIGGCHSGFLQVVFEPVPIYARLLSLPWSDKIHFVNRWLKCKFKILHHSSHVHHARMFSLLSSIELQLCKSV